MPNFNHILLLLTIAGLFSGCVGSTYRRPCIAIPQTWEAEVASADISTGEWPQDNWWTEFNNDELNRIIETALANNYDLKAAVSRIWQAMAGLEIANSFLFPTINARGSGGKSRIAKRVTSPIGTPSDTLIVMPSARSKLFTGAIGGSYAVDLWGKNQFGVEASSATLHASIFDMQEVQLILISTIANTYFQILALKDQINIAQESIANQQSVLKILQIRFRLGAVSLFDVSQQQSQLNIVQATIPPMEQQRDQLVNVLAILTGLNPEGFYITGETLAEVTKPAEAPGGLPSELIERNPRIRKSEEYLIAANANIQAARAAFFPQVLLTGERGYSSPSFSDWFTPQYFFYQIAANVIQTIFDGGFLIGQYDLTRQKYQELLFHYYQSIIAAFRDVENSLIAIEKTIEAEQAQNLAVESSQETFRLSQLQFDKGLIDVTTVLLVQRSLLNTLESQSKAQLAKLNAFVSLYVALGGGLVKQ